MNLQHQTTEDFATVMADLSGQLDDGTIDLTYLIARLRLMVKEGDTSNADAMLAIVQTLNDRIGNETTMDLEDNANHVYASWLAGCHNVIREHGMKIQINRLMEGV